MIRNMAAFLLIIIVAFILLTSCGEEKANTAGFNSVPVKTSIIREKEFSFPVYTSGRIAATEEIKLSFKIGGIVKNIPVSEGELVKKGDLLAELDQSEIAANVAQAQSGYDKAKRDYDRVEKLYKDEVATLEQLQNTETALNVAGASLQIALFNQKHSKIYAPARGRILKQLTEKNEVTGAGYPVFIFGAENAGWIIKTGVTDKDILRIALNDSADVTVDAHPDVMLKAVVTETGRSASPYNGTYEVELTIDATDYRLMSGFVAKVKIYPSLTKPYKLVPIESINEADKSNGVVYIPGEEGSVKKIAVKLGGIIGNDIVVLSGLKDEQEVVTTGSEYLTADSKIKVVN